MSKYKYSYKSDKNINNITEKEEDNDLKCSICMQTFVDPVYMSCMASHEFCFKCILTWVEGKEKIENSCPICRGGDTCILLSNIKPVKNREHPSLYHFLKNKVILEKVLRLPNNENSCVISDKLIFLYLKNKKQLELLNTYNISTIYEESYQLYEMIDIIRWDIFTPINNRYNYASHIRPTTATRTAITAPPPPSPILLRLEEFMHTSSSGSINI